MRVRKNFEEEDGPSEMILSMSAIRGESAETPFRL
jgi:hypothetical protein